MTDTIFDKMLRGEIPNHTVYEDEHVLAFLDIFPLSKGHTVVIPKVKAETLLDLPQEATGTLFEGVQIVTKKLQEVLHPDGFTIGLNQKEVAGQSVPYIHVHVIPRYDGDGGGSLHSVVKQPGDMKVEEVAALFNKI